MAITVVTIDFWNTLFDSSGGTSRNETRRDALLAAVRNAGHGCSEEELESAYKGIWDYFDDHWLHKQRTPTSDEMVREICRRIDLALQEEEIAGIAEIFSRGVLDHPPRLLPGVPEALDYLASRAHLALISDTAFSPGSILRQLMEQSGIAHYFGAYVFSDETGVAKPHPEAFRRALEPFGAHPHEAAHIGDIERTDIRGAKDAGMRAILYKGDNAPHKYAEEETIADAVMESWKEIEQVIVRIEEGQSL